MPPTIAPRGRHSAKPRHLTASQRRLIAFTLLMGLVVLSLVAISRKPVDLQASGAQHHAADHQTRRELRNPRSPPEKEEVAMPPHRLLIATHSRLMWYDLASGQEHVLHEAQVGHA